MAKAKKTPSGKWRTLVYDYTDGLGKRRYRSFTATTKKESEYLASQFLMEKERNGVSDYYNITVGEMLNQYISIKAGTLSPTTINGYISNLHNNFDEIAKLKVKSLNSAILQQWVGNLSLKLSPKSVGNIHGFLMAALNFFNISTKFKVKLPEKTVDIGYIPIDKDIATALEYYKKHSPSMLVAVCLSAFGTLRRSEICALTADDVIGNKIIINKAMIWDGQEKKWTIKKTPKNQSSNRVVEYPDFVIDLLPDEGPLVSIKPSTITSSIRKMRKKLNLPDFRFHDFRHYSASIMHAIGVPDVYIMQRGGWSSDTTLKKIYRNSLEDYNRLYTSQTIDYFNKYNSKCNSDKSTPL